MRIKLRAFFPFSSRCNVIDFLLKCRCLIKLIVHIKRGTVEKVILIIIIRIDFNIVSHWPHILANSVWPLATGQPSPRAFVSVNLLPTCLPPRCPQLSSQFSQPPRKHTAPRSWCLAFLRASSLPLRERSRDWPSLYLIWIFQLFFPFYVFVIMLVICSAIRNIASMVY